MTNQKPMSKVYFKEAIEQISLLNPFIYDVAPNVYFLMFYKSFQYFKYPSMNTFLFNIDGIYEKQVINTNRPRRIYAKQIIRAN